VVCARSAFICLYPGPRTLPGVASGVAFLAALRALSGAIPSGRGAAVTSAFYVVAYSALSLPAILAGVLVMPLGLDTTFEIFGGVITCWRSQWRQKRGTCPPLAG
jgi:hypothetical protein